MMNIINLVSEFNLYNFRFIYNAILTIFFFLIVISYCRVYTDSFSAENYHRLFIALFDDTNYAGLGSTGLVQRFSTVSTVSTYNN